MKTIGIIGVILIVLGILGFVLQRVSFTETEAIVDLGPVEVQAENRRTIPIPDIASGAAVVAGIALVVGGAARRG